VRIHTKVIFRGKQFEYIESVSNGILLSSGLSLLLISSKAELTNHLEEKHNDRKNPS